MHSFHHSRGRVLFEAGCALIISGSCVAAWMDLGVPAFLAVAAVSALYAFVRLSDMRSLKAGFASAEPVIEPDAESAGALLTDIDQSAVAAEPEATAVELVDEALLAEREPITEAAPQPKPKKRRASKKAHTVVLAPVDPPEPAVKMEVGPAESEAYEDHSPVTPLFEPEPFVRQQQRAVFGRKAG